MRVSSQKESSFSAGGAGVGVQTLWLRGSGVGSVLSAGSSSVGAGGYDV